MWQRSRIVCLALLFLSSLMWLASAHADEWRTSAALYAQFAGLRGEAAAGPVSVDIDVSFSDMLDHLDTGGVMALRSENDRWAFAVNAVFLGSEAEIATRTGLLFDVDLTQDLVEATWSWRATEIYELFAGVRYQSLAAEMSVTNAAGATTSALAVESWWDPIVGGRAEWPLGTAWALIARGDIGGFGVGSELTWSALATLEWNVSQSVGLVIGYRALDTDYEGGTGARQFRLNTLVAGPLIGIRFNFGP